MRPDTSAPIIAAARKRHELTRAKAVQALRELDRSGQPVTFASVASTAGISQSWLYSQADICDQIKRMRGARSHGTRETVPADQRASDSSLRARLAPALERNSQLADENARLRRQLARILGDQRNTRPGPTGPQQREGRSC